MVGIAESDFPVVAASPNTMHALALVIHGGCNKVTLCTAPLAIIDGAKTPWRKPLDVDDVTKFDLHGDDLFLLGHHGAPRFQVLRLGRLPR